MLSILQREMRITARAKSTFRLRTRLTALGLIIGAGMVLMDWVGSATGMRIVSPSGAGVFSTATFLAFWFCLFQGVRSAASSISDEKREGTLGLLFLTDLRPLDIILGKLFSIAVPLVQPLLAFVPVLTVSVLLGGVTGGEIFRAALTMSAVLVVSIALGLCVSSYARGTADTGMNTIILLLAWIILPRVIGHRRFGVVRYLSPYSAFANISDPGYRIAGDEFIWSIALMWLATAILLAAATYFVPRRWYEEGAIDQKKKVRSTARIATHQRATLLDRNPGEWLAVRSSGSAAQQWFYRIVIIALALATAVPMVGGAFASLAIVVFVLRLASQASFALGHARTSGSIELLLSTPLPPRTLITGQIAALKKQMLPEALAMLVAGTFSFGASFLLLLPALCFAVAASGMYYGLREKTPNRALFKTLVVTVATPVIGSFVTLLGFLILEVAGRFYSGQAFLSLSPAIAYVVAGAISARHLRGGALELLITPDQERLLRTRPPGWPPRVSVPPKL